MHKVQPTNRKKRQNDTFSGTWSDTLPDTCDIDMIDEVHLIIGSSATSFLHIIQYGGGIAACHWVFPYPTPFIQGCLAEFKFNFDKTFLCFKSECFIKTIKTGKLHLAIS